MTITTSPATLYDMAELGGAQTRVAWGVVRELYDRGEFFAYRAGDELVAIGGVVPLGPFIPGAEEAAEIVFNPAPGARRHMFGVLAAARLTIEAAPYRAIVTIVISEEGAVFARRLGFVHAGPSEHGEVWSYARSTERSGRQGGATAAGAAAGPDRGLAAD